MTTDRNFTHDAIPGRVVFGAGSRRDIAREAERLRATRPLLVGSGHESAVVDEVASLLEAADGCTVAGRFTDIVQHVPDAKSSAAIEAMRDSGADSVVTIGGGSAVGFGKIVRLDIDTAELPAFIAVPTTYSGSEMTAIWGRSDGSHKRTGSDLRVKPDTVIYDPELTMSLPAQIAGPSGMNALAHCVEALYAPGSNPIVSMQALEGVRALAAGLPVVCSESDDLAARSDVLFGAYLAAVALASAGTALHHKTCHVLGGMFDLDHGSMNAIVLGHAVAYNAPAIPDALAKLADALGVSPDATPRALFELSGAIGAPTSLRDIGMPADGLDAAAERVVEHAADNVRRPEFDGIRQMLDDAYRGRPPG